MHCPPVMADLCPETLCRLRVRDSMAQGELTGLLDAIVRRQQRGCPWMAGSQARPAVVRVHRHLKGHSEQQTARW